MLFVKIPVLFLTSFFSPPPHSLQNPSSLSLPLSSITSCIKSPIATGCTTKILWRVVSITQATEEDLANKKDFPRKTKKAALPPVGTYIFLFSVIISRWRLLWMEMSCPILYCTVLYCTVLYCTVLYCTVLYCTALYCDVLYCTVLYCTVLYCYVRARINSMYFCIFYKLSVQIVPYVLQIVSTTPVK